MHDWMNDLGARSNERRELKVRLPLDMHLRMHGIKVMHEQNLSDTVEHALELYFRALEAGDIEPNGTPRRKRSAPRAEG